MSDNIGALLIDAVIRETKMKLLVDLPNDTQDYYDGCIIICFAMHYAAMTGANLIPFKKSDVVCITKDNLIKIVQN